MWDILIYTSICLQKELFKTVCFCVSLAYLFSITAACCDDSPFYSSLDLKKKKKTFLSSDFCVLLSPFLASVPLTRSLSWFLLSSLACLFTLLPSTSPWCVIMNFLQWPPFRSLAYLKSPEGVLHLLALCFFFLLLTDLPTCSFSYSPIPLFSFPSVCLPVCLSLPSKTFSHTAAAAICHREYAGFLSPAKNTPGEPDARSYVAQCKNMCILSH